jgi:hypothetical protein
MKERTKIQIIGEKTFKPMSFPTRNGKREFPVL